MNRFWIAVAAGGALAGTLDIIYACVWLWSMHGKAPLWVLQSVATGWLGKAAFTGGVAAGALGLASHYAISVAAAATYGYASRSVAFLSTHWLVAGALFGVLVYLFMNFVVIPLSAAPFKPSLDPNVIAQGFVSHALLFGIPIAGLMRRLAPAQPAPRESAG
jgi:hypothetical protein